MPGPANAPKPEIHRPSFFGNYLLDAGRFRPDAWNFCRRLAPVSESGTGSFSVTPSSPRSMPNPLLEKMELVRMRLPMERLPTSTPLPLLKATTLSVTTFLEEKVAPTLIPSSP